MRFIFNVYQQRTRSIVSLQSYILYQFHCRDATLGVRNKRLDFSHILQIKRRPYAIPHWLRYYR